MLIQRNKGGVSTMASSSGGKLTKPTIAPVVVRNNAPQQAGSSLGKVEGTGVQFIEYTLTNGTGATVTYIIGDAYGQAVAASGKTVSQPTSTTSGTVAGQKLLFATRPVQIGRINFQTSSNAAQFQQALNTIKTNQAGASIVEPLRIGPFKSSQDYNALVRTVDFTNAPNPIILSDEAGLLVDVLAGESLYLGMEVLNRVAR